MAIIHTSYVGVYGYIHIVADDITSPAAVTAEERTCVEVLQSLCEKTKQVNRCARRSLASKHGTKCSAIRGTYSDYTS